MQRLFSYSPFEVIGYEHPAPDASQGAAPGS